MYKIFKKCPAANKASKLPYLILFLAVLSSIPLFAMGFVAFASEFTRIYSSNGSALYVTYFWLRTVLAPVSLICLSAFAVKKLVPPMAVLALFSLIVCSMKLGVSIVSYADKMSSAELMSIQPNYTQNYMDLSESILLVILTVSALLYFTGVIKTAFPILMFATLASIIILYSIISAATTYEMNLYDVMCRSYGVPYCLGSIAICFCVKPKHASKGRRYRR